MTDIYPTGESTGSSGPHWIAPRSSATSTCATLARPATALGPRHEVGLARDRHRLAIPVGGERRADPATVGADDADRQPGVGRWTLAMQIPTALVISIRGIEKSLPVIGARE